MEKVLLLIMVCAAVAVYSFPHSESDVSSTSEESIEKHQHYQGSRNYPKAYKHTNAHQGGPPVLYTSNPNPQNETADRRVRETNDQKAAQQSSSSAFVEAKLPARAVLPYGPENTSFGNTSSNNQPEEARNPEVLISSEQRITPSVLATTGDSLSHTKGSNLQRTNTDGSGSNTRSRREDSEKTTTEDNLTTKQPDDVSVIELIKNPEE